MKPAFSLSQIGTERAAPQNLRPAMLRALEPDYGRVMEGVFDER